MRKFLSVALVTSLALIGAIVAAPSGGSSPAMKRRPHQWEPLPIEPRVLDAVHGPSTSRPARTLAPRPPVTSTHRRVGARPQGVAPGATVEFEGINQAGGGGAVPPDANGDVGPNHYVQTTNFGSFAVWNKQGQQLVAPTNMGLLYPAGDPCRELGRGDPVVQYDQFANRWLITQFAFARDANFKRVPPFYECIAITDGSQPDGHVLRLHVPDRRRPVPRLSTLRRMARRLLHVGAPLQRQRHLHGDGHNRVRPREPARRATGPADPILHEPRLFRTAACGRTRADPAADQRAQLPRDVPD